MKGSWEMHGGHDLKVSVRGRAKINAQSKSDLWPYLSATIWLRASI